MPFKKRNKFLKVIFRRDKPFYLTVRRPLILKGNWDLCVSLYRDYSTYVFIRELVENSLDYTKCSRYKDLIERITRGEVKELTGKEVVLDSVEAVDRHMQYYVKIIENMRRNGFIDGLGKDSVEVMIGRDGRLIKEEHGRHRLAIAQVLKLDAITVKVIHIHVKWIQKNQISELPEFDNKVIKEALINVEKIPAHIRNRNVCELDQEDFSNHKHQ